MERILRQVSAGNSLGYQNRLTESDWLRREASVRAGRRICSAMTIWSFRDSLGSFRNSSGALRSSLDNGTSRQDSAVSKLVLVIVVWCVLVCCGLPVSPANTSTSAMTEAVDYLIKYGYLPRPDPSTGNLRSEDQLRRAIALMQRFANLTPTGVADAPTIRQMRRRRCGVPDFLTGQSGMHRVRRYALQGQRWPTTHLTWSVLSRGPASEVRMVRAQLDRAFSVWSSGTQLNFTEILPPTPADIVVSFLKGPHGDGYPFDGEGSVLAHAFFPGEGIGGDAHFDADERWLPSQPRHEDEGVNLFAVAAHEIGHSLGLSHSSAPGSLMFPYYRAVDEHFVLPQDDAEGIRHLYGFKDFGKQPTMPTLEPTTPSLEPTTPSSEPTSDVTPTSVETTSPTKATVPTSKAGKYPTKKTTTKHKAKSEATTTPLPDIPDVCSTSIDAISIIRREIFVFKGKYFWRLNGNRTMRKGYPVPISRLWRGLPPDVSHLDAVYERPTDTKIVFFAGKLYWLFSATDLEANYPRPLTDLGLPNGLERVEAALVWGHNGKTYLFSGKEYWKLDEGEGKVELDYPRSISNWNGVPSNLDAAFQWNDGNSYFFKDQKYWKFCDDKMTIENKSSLDVGTFWFECTPRTTVEPEVTPTSTPAPTILPPENSAVACRLPSVYLLLVLFLFT